MANDPRLEAMGDTPGSDVCGCMRATEPPNTEARKFTREEIGHMQDAVDQHNTGNRERRTAPNTEALLATVRTALRQGQRAMNELVWTHATLDPEADLDAIASELEREVREHDISREECVRAEDRARAAEAELEQAWKDYEVQREYADEQYRKALAAEAELKRANREADEAVALIASWREKAAKHEDSASGWKLRAEAAEAELETVRAERDLLREEGDVMLAQLRSDQARLDKAVAALREAPIAECVGIGCSCPRCAALAEMEESG